MKNILALVFMVILAIYTDAAPAPQYQAQQWDGSPVYQTASATVNRPSPQVAYPSPAACCDYTVNGGRPTNPNWGK